MVWYLLVLYQPLLYERKQGPNSISISASKVWISREAEKAD